MQLDIFFNADQHIQIKGRNGKKYSMSEACEDIVAHEKLTDEVRDFLVKHSDILYIKFS